MNEERRVAEKILRQETRQNTLGGLERQLFPGTTVVEGESYLRRNLVRGNEPDPDRALGQVRVRYHLWQIVHLGMIVTPGFRLDIDTMALDLIVLARVTGEPLDSYAHEALYIACETSRNIDVVTEALRPLLELCRTATHETED